jgi:hypothetical protein
LSNQLLNILTFNEQTSLEDCDFYVTVITIPQGQKGEKLIILNEDIRTKKCITIIKNIDNLCCLRG